MMPEAHLGVGCAVSLKISYGREQFKNRQAQAWPSAEVTPMSCLDVKQ
jgi:hypothetical protein